MQKVRVSNCPELIHDDYDNFTMFGPKSFSALVNCLRPSKNFPCTNFRFDRSSDGLRMSREMSKFIWIFGEYIETIKFSIDNQLILDRFPNLKRLEIDFVFDDDSSLIQHSVDSNQLQLLKLEVLRVDCMHGYRKFRNTVACIVRAAPNLKQFVGTLDGYGMAIEDYVMFESLGKLHCLKDVVIEITEDWIDYWKNNPKLVHGP